MKKIYIGISILLFSSIITFCYCNQLIRVNNANEVSSNLSDDSYENNIDNSTFYGNISPYLTPETKRKLVKQIINYDNFIEGVLIDCEYINSDEECYQKRTVKTDTGETYTFNTYTANYRLYNPGRYFMGTEFLTMYPVNELSIGSKVKVYYDGTLEGNTEKKPIKTITDSNTETALWDWVSEINKKVDAYNDDDILTPEEAILLVCKYRGMTNLNKQTIDWNPTANYYYDESHVVYACDIRFDKIHNKPNDIYYSVVVVNYNNLNNPYEWEYGINSNGGTYLVFMGSKEVYPLVEIKGGLVIPTT